MMMMGSAPSAAAVPTPPDLRLQIITVLLDLASHVRDAGPQLAAALTELANRERSVAEREAAVAAREEPNSSARGWRGR
jgi:hypothetical protein